VYITNKESVVSVWDTNTGDKLMQFVNAHHTIERGVEVPVEITALCFDYNGRRLMTGARNGTIHVWNFNNGLLMQEFELPDASAVTGIACAPHYFYTSGWGKLVYVYIDGGGEEHRKAWKQRHKEDVHCIAFLAPNIIASGGYDGDVVIWSRDTGQVYCRLNAFESVKPVTEHTQRRNTITKLPSRPLTVELQTDENVSPSKSEETRSPSTWVRRKRLATTIGLMNRMYRTTDTSPEEEEELVDHPLLNALDPESFNTSEKTLYTREEYDAVCKNYESSVEKILFLEKREPLHKDVAVLITCGAEGWVRFWSVHHDGGLLGQFNAAHRLGESVLSIVTDASETLLVTGDTQGYVKIWDIMDYCTGKKMNMKETTERIDFLRKNFTFYRVENYDGKPDFYTIPDHLRNVFASRPPPTSSDPSKTLVYPPLVNSFRAHLRSIHSVDFISDRGLLITASADCSVRMWTVNGHYIGTFGGPNWKPLPKVVNNDYFLSQVQTQLLYF